MRPGTLNGVRPAEEPHPAPQPVLSNHNADPRGVRFGEAGLPLGPSLGLGCEQSQPASPLMDASRAAARRPAAKSP